MNSDMGFFWKFIFTPLWIAAFGTGALIEFLRKSQLELLLVWVVGASLLYWLLGRLKKVTFSSSEKKLYISNFFRGIEVPFDEVEKVSGSLMLVPEVIFIRLKSRTAFGRRIIFMPRIRILGGYSEHPVAEELRQTIFGETKGRGPGVRLLK